MSSDALQTPAADERQPLLSPDAPRHADDAAESQEEPTPETKRTWWTIGWYAVLTLAGTFVAAVFIKGFADPDGKVSQSEYFEHEERRGVTWSIQVQGMITIILCLGF